MENEASGPRFAHGVRVGQFQPMKGRDRVELLLIALLVFATAAMIGLTVWDWIRS